MNDGGATCCCYSQLQQITLLDIQRLLLLDQYLLPLILRRTWNWSPQLKHNYVEKTSSVFILIIYNNNELVFFLISSQPQRESVFSNPSGKYETETRQNYLWKFYRTHRLCLFYEMQLWEICSVTLIKSSGINIFALFPALQNKNVTKICTILAIFQF